MVWQPCFFCPEIHRNKAVVCLYGLLAASPTGEPDIDQEQKREVGSPLACLAANVICSYWFKEEALVSLCIR